MQALRRELRDMCMIDFSLDSQYCHITQGTVTGGWPISQSAVAAESGDGPIVLALAPTRELAVQIQQECIKFGSSSRIKNTCVLATPCRRCLACSRCALS